MDAWGEGPLQNGAALDYLSQLTTTVEAQEHWRSGVIPGTTNQGRVFEQMLATMADAKRASRGLGISHHDAYVLYGLAGLVAGVVHADQEELSELGGAAFDRYRHLLEPSTAAGLMSFTTQVCDLLLENESWLASWPVGSTQMRARVLHLKGLLADKEARRRYPVLMPEDDLAPVS